MWIFFICDSGVLIVCRAAIGIIVGTILQAGSVNYGMMIFARIVSVVEVVSHPLGIQGWKQILTAQFNGIFNGMLTSTVPTYQSECSRPERRGPDVMISATVNIFVSNDEPPVRFAPKQRLNGCRV